MQSHKRAKELFRYDPKTGSLTRRVSRGRWRAGEPAGTIRTRVDATVHFEGRDMSMARFIYWLRTGEFPKAHVDHKNGNPLDFRWKNLRAATPSQNNANQKPRPNETGYPGVKRHGTAFTATIAAAGWIYYLGRFKTAKAAGRAYKEAKAHLHGEWNRQTRRPKAGLLSYTSKRQAGKGSNGARRPADKKGSASR